jgi:chemotaxis protein CheX
VIDPEIEVTEEDLFASTANIWFSTLEMDVRRAESAIPLRQGGEPMATGCVNIYGGWEGVLVIDCPTSLARAAAGRMLSVPAAEIAPADLQDAVGELTNIIAGNIKNDFPGECRLSLPVVTEGSDYTVHVGSGRLFCEVYLVCENQPIHVALFERN